MERENGCGCCGCGCGCGCLMFIIAMVLVMGLVFAILMPGHQNFEQMIPDTFDEYYPHFNNSIEPNYGTGSFLPLYGLSEVPPATNALI